MSLSQVEISHSSHTAPNKNTNPKVLVVDDHPENLVAMRHILNKLHGDIICVESGNEALQQILRHDFSVVLMDVQMPKMNGFETAELIRGNDETKNLPIIFVTAISKEKQYVVKGYQLGAIDYLFKPFDPQILRYKVSVFMDLERQRTAFLKLAKKNQLILDSVNEGVLGLSNDGKIIFCNPAATRLLELSKDALEGKIITHFIQDYKATDWEESEIYRVCIRGHNCQRQLYFSPDQSSVFPAECNATPLSDNKDISGFVLVFNDISLRLKAEQQLTHLAEYDPLTGLANRRIFYRNLPKVLAKAKRMGHQIALLFIDIDHFKTINDTLGHMIGDQLLTRVAERLLACVRESDTVVRLSGDEFTVILEGNLNSGDIAKIAKKIVQSIAQRFDFNQQVVNCSASVGIAQAPSVSWNADELIKAADTAMYSAKKLGRNNYQFYDKALSKKISYKVQVETQLFNGIKNNEFKLVYQPKVDISSGITTGAEALLRWNSATLGEISPALFIPIAEDSGRIQEVGHWVMQEANRQLSQWRRDGSVGNDFSLSVNFSIKQLNNPNFLMQLEKSLIDHALDPHYLDVEITETTLMSNPGAIIPILRVLHEMGMTISVDDFGTGYSSLSYLNQLPIDNLKIDQSFVKNLFQDDNSEIITHSIINLAHNLNLKVVAEGIETEEQKEFLLHNKCDMGQGYYYSRPIQAGKFIGSLGNPY